MVPLFLSEPNWDAEEGDNEASSQIVSLLSKLGSVIWSLMVSGGRSEARLWLCNAVSRLSSISPHHKRDIFMKMLTSKPTRKGLASQLLQLVFEKRPRKVGSILANKSYLLEKFFQGNPKRIMQWFSNFGDGSGLEHKKGAKALSQFAFVNRDICWDELEWKGKHGQSPAMVATKPHYFLDLDVQRTVENFLENVPEFWSSPEFAESLKDGEILFMDTKFFVELFIDLMYKEDLDDIWEVISEFLKEESFSSLCHHLLIILEESEFRIFLELLLRYISPRIKHKDFGNSSYLLEFILCKCGDPGSFDTLLMLNAIINQRRQLLRLVNDEECQDENEQVKDIVSQMCKISTNTYTLASILKECAKAKPIEAIKLLGLYSWVIYYRLSKECQTPGSWEALFLRNGISFHESDKYSMLNNKGPLDENDSAGDDRASSRHRKKKKRRKKTRYFDHDSGYDDELLDFDASERRLGLQSGGGSWLLSIDDFSTSWTNVDLPEHLSNHCLSTWMKQLASQWSNVANAW
ncbi:uncharacterized protein LOC108473748 [Gossypium arboreum]|uniref:Uncharacterized protein n=1 Tax=Gossypium arboreum TaxID=29729 RepID=A0ABR0N0Y0_GOSAR|nr:uncharacterized protein LOC108473748 [Gossypium arboreum]KAK5784209.1 hypothetical protein PVK06_038729 [Gossypium arboreum]